MSVIARHIIATPARSASDAWKVIVSLLAPKAANTSIEELKGITGIASSLISGEAMKEAPIIVYGSGPRVRIYCLYGEDAIIGETANEDALTFDATEGDWKMSLPCPKDDLDWINEALEKRSNRITARNMTDPVEVEESERKEVVAINLEAFLRS